MLRITVFAALLATVGCSTSGARTSGSSQEELELSRRQVQELREHVSTLSGRLEGMEMTMASLRDELKAKNTSAETLARKKEGADATVEVTPHASERMGKPIVPEKASSDPELGFTTDSAVDSYRNAMTLFESKKYPESMLAFTGFLEQYADHPWAGAAQFYVGQAYFMQKECRLALQEYQRVLTSYDRSSHVADSLKQMSICEEELKMPQAAAKHRQLLTSLFPNSPAARSLVAEATSKSPEQAAPVQTAPPTAPSEGNNKQ
ncbi:MAG: hypothetical protein KGQ59_00185 [Bdellovibrionales bacterium]|nr:hypothetical protein [Bdellovibrionales bacterium]